MHRVDDPGEDVEAGAVGDAVRRVRERADGDDTAAAHADIDLVLAILVDHGAVLEDRVVLRHVAVSRWLLAV